MAEQRHISDHDVQEVSRFQQYLLDLRSNMTDEDFADKWHEYMGVPYPMALRHVKIERGER